MKPLCCFAALMLTLAIALPGLTDDKTDDSLRNKEGFVPIFDGKTLKGWKADDEAKKHWQPKDGKLICDGKGDALRTERAYGGLEILVDFRFPTKDSKPCAFLVHDGADGHARVTVSPDGKVSLTFKGVIRTQGPGKWTEESSKGASAALKPAGKWNRLQVTDAGGTFKLTIIGTEAKELTTPVSPRRGAFVLQPGSAMGFANLFVREHK